MIEIKHTYTKEIIFKADVANIKLAVELAIKSDISLRYADLSYANLRYADLSYANLSYADLSSADLRSANLSYADLSSANLSYANLRSADLSCADLSYANLIVFQFQKNWAYYTFEGTLRIGCVVLPITKWKEKFQEIGVNHQYTSDQILMYGQFINMCYEHFLRNNS